MTIQVQRIDRTTVNATLSHSEITAILRKHLLEHAKLSLAAEEAIEFVVVLEADKAPRQPNQVGDRIGAQCTITVDHRKEPRANPAPAANFPAGSPFNTAPPVYRGMSEAPEYPPGEEPLEFVPAPPTIDHVEPRAYPRQADGRGKK